MPANEQTWRNIPLLHRVFAISSVLVLLTTIWVFWNDQRREWRTTQTKVVKLDTTMNRWRQQQYDTNAAHALHEQEAHEKMQVDAEFIEPELFSQFETEVKRFNDNMESLEDPARLSYDASHFIKRQQDQAELAKNSAAAWDAARASRKAAEEAERTYQQKRAAAKKDTDETVEAARRAAEAAETTAINLEDAAIEASRKSSEMRQEIVAELNNAVIKARNYENVALSTRKFKSADLDASKASIDIAVRDNLTRQMESREQRVTKLRGEYDKLNVNYQRKNQSRLALQLIVTQMISRQTEAAKEFQDAQAGLATLKKQYAEREQAYFTTYDSFPWVGPGKRILNLPILNAFNAPQKVENLWSEGLVQNYNFRNVRRFDRCTTCHQAMQRSLPGSPTDPAYIHASEVVYFLSPPEKVLPEGESSASELQKLEYTYGLRLASEGIINFDDVTVSLVLPNSSAAKAQQEPTGYAAKQLSAAALRESVAAFTSSENEGESENAESQRILPGLMSGDVLLSVNDSKVAYGPSRVATLLLDAVGSKQPIRVVVRRGFDNPYTTHPRLDLFVGDASPHPMGTFGCSICHDGQGSATAFKWSSHTPNDGDENPNQSMNWAQEYGWFDNHHWIYPMYPKRFAEAACLKCHHDVTELEPSEKFAEAPAAKVTHGYHLIRKFGCYGCHEVNGYDGPEKRVGPDLRSEPNFFAAALQLGHLLPARLTDLEHVQAMVKSKFEELHNVQADGLTDDEKAKQTAQAKSVEADLNRTTLQVEQLKRAIEIAPEVAARNFDKSLREELYQLFLIDAAIKEPAQRAFTTEQHRVANVLKDVESPGTLRKPGPTLRFVRSKLDSTFLYDWTNNPRNFRPDTRMPKFFGLWDHLESEPDSLHDSERLEPVEIHGIVAFLNNMSQSFVPLPKPPGIADSTPEASRERGRVAFETRGCLACHQHQDFSDTRAFRDKNEIAQGPDLSRLAAKFDANRNPQGREWLYGWIKNPTRYNVRTLMPNLFLDPVETKDADGKATSTDPVGDIVEYLTDPAHLQSASPSDKTIAGASAADSAGSLHSHSSLPTTRAAWQPVPQATQAVESAALKSLVIEYLRESFHESRLEGYYENGIPARLRGELKVAEQDLLVEEGGKLTDAQRLSYVGRKSISKFGCYGCHDIPGFEDAKPIGTGLADWGRKDPSRLAFEHISHYLEHGHGHASKNNDAGHDNAEHKPASDTRHDATAAQMPGDHIAPPMPSSDHASTDHAALDRATHGSAEPSHDSLPKFYDEAISHGHRSGFIFQKLREPRSYDYMKTANKKYNDRLRMPEFPFNIEEREAVITFVLGLVSEPPAGKYLYAANPRQKAIAAGKQVLETFNCGGCHVLESEQWKLSFSPDTFEPQSSISLPSFAQHTFDPAVLAKSAARDRRGETSATIYGLPALAVTDALPQVRDAEDEELDDATKYSPLATRYGVDIYQAVALDGKPYQRGLQPLQIPGSTVEGKYPSLGGFLAKYLAPRVLELERKANPKAPGNEAYGWLPPPLMGEGSKVQSDWLYEFLREPYAIRPATFLRMPKFNLSPDDTTKLVNYFAARDNAEYPYVLDQRRLATHLDSRQAAYVKTASADEKKSNTPETDKPNNNDAEALDNAVDEKDSGSRSRLDAALAIVTKTQCVQCHRVGDYVPTGPARAQGPNLAQVYRRLRPDYTRKWLANPKMFLPYTPMPVNIFKYDPEAEHLGGLDQKLFHGTSIEQLDGVVDLLMNFDEYAKQQTRIADLVPPQPAGTPAEEPPVEAGASTPSP